MGWIAYKYSKKTAADSDTIDNDDGQFGQQHPRAAEFENFIPRVPSTVQPMTDKSITISGNRSATDLPPEYESPLSYDQCVWCYQVESNFV